MNILLIIIICLLYNILSELSYLEKYSSLSTTENYILFESKTFLGGDRMDFKFEISNNNIKDVCENILKYKYYSNKEIDNYQNVNFEYSVSGNQDDNSNYIFTIIKQREQLNEGNGYYLLLNFNCNNNQVKITNFKKESKKSGSNDTDIVMAIVFPIFAVFVLLFTICCCCYDTKQKIEKLGNILDNGNISPSPANSYSQDHQIHERNKNNSIIYKKNDSSSQNSSNRNIQSNIGIQINNKKK